MNNVDIIVLVIILIVGLAFGIFGFFVIYESFNSSETVKIKEPITPEYVDCLHNVVCYRLGKGTVVLSCTHVQNITECN
jgi:hypothetical protein